MRKRGIVGRGSAVGLLALGLSTGSLGGSARAADDEAELTVLSSRPDMVSSGDALLAVSIPSGAPPADVRVTVNGADATPAFRPDPAGQRLVGLVDRLQLGSNTVTAALGDGPATTVTLVNHPGEGPVFSGPHEEPFVCETEAFELQSGEKLGAPLDEHCSVARRVDYVYRATGTDTLTPLADPAALPADVATTTLAGREVPYVVRIETGTANRA
ncbi:MAG: DUF6351 family protein, partial [Acidobacteria bacterium]|nr:DUF6351 family protein [Acidobacteriota bacterium]